MQALTPVGGQPERRTRRFDLLIKDFTQVEQSQPIPIAYGQVKRAGVQFVPIFGFRSTAITTKAGK